MGKEIEKFEESIHYAEICEWYNEHNLRAPGLEVLPEYGLIIRDLAAGFLIWTDCGLGILEFFISNPKSNKKERDLALDLITRGLMDHGAEMGLHYFKCASDRPQIIARAERFGFKNVGQFTSLFYHNQPEFH